MRDLSSVQFSPDGHPDLLPALRIRADTASDPNAFSHTGERTAQFVSWPGQTARSV